MNQFRKDQVQDIYYLSAMQEGMLFHTIMHPGQGLYFEQISMKIEGSIRSDLLEKSMQKIIDRYDIFRTVFIHEKMKRPVQVVLKQLKFNVREVDLTGVSENEQNQCIEIYKQEDKETGFDLSKEMPMRMTIFKKAATCYEWVWSYHHILLDGWCFSIVVKEILQVYQALLNNQTYHLAPVKPYKEYIKWLEKKDKQKSFLFWDDYLSGFEGQTTFAEQRKKGPEAEQDSEELTFNLTEEETRVFSESARGQGITLNTAIQAVWAVVLSRYQRSSDIIFGTVVSGRPAEIEGVETMVGLFINVVPKRIQVRSDCTFAQLVSEIQSQSLESETHQYVPLYDLQSRSTQPDLIDHILVFENYPLPDGNLSEDESIGFTIRESSFFEKTNYSFNLIAAPGKEFMLKIAYNSTVYERAFIERLKDHMLGIISQASLDSSIKIKDIRLVSEEDEKQLLSAFNGVHLSELDDLTLHTWFEKFAEETPERLALTFENQSFTYSELNEKANQLAHQLIARGIEPGKIVALLVGRSPEMIIGILAILKAGGAYLPIDPEYPEERVRYMLEDCASSLILTQEKLTGKIDSLSYKGGYICLDDHSLYNGDKKNPEVRTAPDGLVYVLYTSGTTGKPKGILTTHRNVLRVVKKTNYIDITRNDTLLSVSNYAFDGFTFDLYGALLNGAKLVLAANETILHTERLMRLIEDEEITVMFSTTALFNLLVDAVQGQMKGLRKVLFGGERSSVKHVRKALDIMGPGRIIHVYGPTETTVFATFYPVISIPDDAVTIPIGKPITMTGAYILSPENQLQPLEAAGELILSGTGLARGYLNRPELTQEKFTTHPFIETQRIYRTGDLARWLPNGNIEFLGRIDDQVKIRGHRIELGEIQEQLMKIQDVKEVFVQAVTSDLGDTAVCAYVVPEKGCSLTIEYLQKQLVKVLPVYMIPASYVLLDKLPLTTNGKVNRKLLPEAQKQTGTVEKTTPRTKVEGKLADIWSEVLGVPSIGIHDNFFSLGGHSLKAMALCAQILKTFQIDIPVRVLFESPTIAEIAGFLESINEETTQTDGLQLELTVLNPDGIEKMFVFPPVLGYGIMFGELAKHLPDHRIHAFDFIEADDRVERYVNIIEDFQPEGFITILGYSAGCGLAFEVAQAIEQRGRSVNRLIMVDSYKKTAVSDIGGRSVNEDVAALMDFNQDNPYLKIESIRQGLARKMTIYYRYFVDSIHSGQVEAPIHLIRSDYDRPIPFWMTSWQEATRSSYAEHQGYGKHDDMLQGKFVETNARIIRTILKEGVKE